MSTATAAQTGKKILNDANPSNLEAVLAPMEVGDMLTVVDETITQTAAATMDLSTAAPAASVLRRGLQQVTSVRVTAVGTAALGHRRVSDPGDTPAATLATLSADGKTLTFEGTVTGVRIVGTPRPAVALSALFPPTS